jgi:hypothetical protein
MSNLHQAFVFDEAAFRRDLAPILDRQDTSALEEFLRDYRSQLSGPEPDDDHFAARAAWALTAYYDATKNIGLGSVASKCRFGLIDLYPEGRVFVGGGVLPVVPGAYQSAGYVAESVGILERLRAEFPHKAELIDPVLTMLQSAADAQQGLYIIS